MADAHGAIKSIFSNGESFSPEPELIPASPGT